MENSCLVLAHCGGVEKPRRDCFSSGALRLAVTV